MKTPSKIFHADYEQFMEGHKHAMRIRCSECSAQDHFIIMTGRPLCTKEFANRKFRNMGWQLGSNRRKDVCPSCSSTRARKKGGSASAYHGAS